MCVIIASVKNILKYLVSDMRSRQVKGIGLTANMIHYEVMAFSKDSLEKMQQMSTNFTFSYFIDSAQVVDKNYLPFCSPDFFGANKALILMHYGHFYTSDKNNLSKKLPPAVSQISAISNCGVTQPVSYGCSTKWKAYG